MPSERFGRRERARLQELARIRPPEQTLAWNELCRIDEERLWWTMQGLDRDALMVLFARALAEVPVVRLERVFRDYVRPGQIGASKEQAEQGLLANVEKFYGLARRGHFYEEIPYRGSQQSRGTELFVARCNALFDRSVALSGSGEPAEVRAAIEMLMDLMRRIDEEDIVYFTDEAGAWQVHVLWDRVLPAYFVCLARTATRSEYQAAVDRALADFGAEDMRTLNELRQAAEQAWDDRPGKP
jgi:hypothetical protein